MGPFGHDFKGKLNLNPFVLCIVWVISGLLYGSYFYTICIVNKYTYIHGNSLHSDIYQ